MDTNAGTRPEQRAPRLTGESRIGIAAFLISAVLVATFPIIVYLPFMTENRVGPPDGGLRLGDFLLMYCWLPLLGVDCLLTVAALRVARRKKRFAMAAAIVNAGLVLLVVLAFSCTRI